jgi:hypothetical protein
MMFLAVASTRTVVYLLLRASASTCSSMSSGSCVAPDTLNSIMPGQIFSRNENSTMYPLPVGCTLASTFWNSPVLSSPHRRASPVLVLRRSGKRHV